MTMRLIRKQLISTVEVNVKLRMSAWKALASQFHRSALTK